MKPFAHQLVISGSVTALTLLASSMRPAQALITQSFSVDITDGGLAGETFSGSFSYEETLLLGTGLETLGAADGISINFDFLDTTYTEVDDLGFVNGFLPEIAFVDSVFSGLNYLVDTGDLFFSFDEGTGLGLPGTSFTYELGDAITPTDAGSGILSTEGSSTTVPEPATLLGLFILGSWGWLMKAKAIQPSNPIVK